MNPSHPSTPNASHLSRMPARPTPPGRTKRHSLTPTSRANISRTIDAAKANATGSANGHAKVAGNGEAISPGPIPSPRGALMQGLRDRSEEDISRAGRVELERVLREEWESKDRLISRIENLSIEQDRLENERKELVQSLGGLQSRVDEAFSEQGRLEADVESRDQMLERMRIKGAETDKALREAQRRYTEQEKSFEAEREAYRAQETHLQSRIHTLTRSTVTTSASGSTSSATSHAAEQAEALTEELASLSAAHCSLIAQYNTTSKEVLDLKAENKRLEEENAGWELLMRDQTMSGSVRVRGMFSEDWLDEGMSDDEGSEMHPASEGAEVCNVEKVMPAKSKGPVKRRPTVLESLDEEMEMGIDEEVGQGAAGGMSSTGSEGDLAAELGRVEGAGMVPLVSARTIKPTEADALRAEVKSLKDANKALSLYCSKIIDRIIAQEGFEHILSVDYKTRRGRAGGAGHAATSSGADCASDIGTSGRPRGSVQDLVHNMQAHSAGSSTRTGEADDFLQNTKRSTVAVPSSVVTPPTPAKEPRKARPLSMMVRGWSYAGDNKEKAAISTEGGSREGSASPEKAVVVDKEEEVKAEKRAKRGFSIDFRSFGFGSSSAPAEPKEPKGLKPLHLPQRQASGSYPAASSSGLSSNDRSRATSPIAPSPVEASSPGLGAPHARKLPQVEEDEEDRRERHRMEAAMRLMGINCGVESEDGGLSSPVDLSHLGIGTGTFSEEPGSTSADMSRQASSSPEKARVPLPGTPLSRLTSALSGTASSRASSSPMLELADPMSPVDDDAARAALKAFDAREAAQAKAMASGKAQTGYTTPTRKVGEGRRRLSGRRGPGSYSTATTVGTAAEMGTAGEYAGLQPKPRGVSKSESISTLFSAGTDSPSGSIDWGKGNNPSAAEARNEDMVKA